MRGAGQNAHRSTNKLYCVAKNAQTKQGQVPPRYCDFSSSSYKQESSSYQVPTVLQGCSRKQREIFLKKRLGENDLLCISSDVSNSAMAIQINDRRSRKLR